MNNPAAGHSLKPVLRVQDLAVSFSSVSGGLFHRKERELRAVDGISFELKPGETLGVVGESGSGKSTLARAILGLVQTSRGRVQWMGEDLTGLDEESRGRRKELQIVFQDPVASLNPRDRRRHHCQRCCGHSTPHGTPAGRGADARHDEMVVCCPIRSIAIRMSFPAASASVSASPARWC
jgi:ABC-type glutathione transport system ATPase component